MHISKILSTFALDFVNWTKVKRFAIYICLLLALPVWSEEHVQVGSPDTWSVQKLAPYIGDTVVFDVPMVVCSNRNRLLMAPWRMYEPLCQGLSGSSAYATALRINSSAGFSLTGIDEYHRCGEKLHALRAVVNSASELQFVSGEWKGNTREELEKGIPDVGDYRLLVCAFNLENYFAVNMGSMGARTEVQHQAQREKISKALTAINADIFGLVELEREDGAIEEIVNDLNKNIPGRHYTYFRSGYYGSQLQRSDYVYDADVVEPIGTPSIINTEVENRKRFVCFKEKATGEKFIFSINHFKAMTGGATATNSQRVNEARSVVNFYNSYRRNANVLEDDLLVMGDLNTHPYTDPIRVFTENGLIDLHRAFHADSSYSYMYSGLASYIDHALCNETLYRQITGMAAYHINSDESDQFTYDKSDDRSMFRCSDHDPVLVGLRLDSTKTFEPAPQINTAEIWSGEADRMIIEEAHKADQKSYYAVYTISGLLLERQEITSVFHEAPLPETAGVYIVYIYANGQVYKRKVIVR